MGRAIRIEVDGAVRHLVLCRPDELNTITPVLRDELGAALDAADRDNDRGPDRVSVSTRPNLIASTRHTGDTETRSFRQCDAPVSEIDEDVWSELTRLRSSIDNIDAAVVHMLAERFKATQRIEKLKADHQLLAADPERERQQITRLR